MHGPPRYQGNPLRGMPDHTSRLRPGSDRPMRRGCRLVETCEPDHRVMEWRDLMQADRPRQKGRLNAHDASRRSERRREPAWPKRRERSVERARTSRRVRAFTLIELLITLAVLGLAGVLVIPAMTQTNGLRVQAAVRTLVADITYAQGDAMAYQTRRVLWFGKVPSQAANGNWSIVDGNGYVLAEVNGAVLNLDTDVLYDPGDPDRPYGRDFDDASYGGATLTDININGEELLIFDELGGPVAELDGPNPGTGGTITIAGPDDVFIVTVIPYTGRVTVERDED